LGPKRGRKELVEEWKAIGRGWVNEGLGMGDESQVTQAIGRLNRKGQPESERLKRRLEQVYEDHNGKVEVRMCEFRD
jgi:hypothetical protein